MSFGELDLGAGERLSADGERRRAGANNPFGEASLGSVIQPPPQPDAERGLARLAARPAAGSRRAADGGRVRRHVGGDDRRSGAPAPRQGAGRAQAPLAAAEDPRCILRADHRGRRGAGAHPVRLLRLLLHQRRDPQERVRAGRGRRREEAPRRGQDRRLQRGASDGRQARRRARREAPRPHPHRRRRHRRAGDGAPLRKGPRAGEPREALAHQRHPRAARERALPRRRYGRRVRARPRSRQGAPRARLGDEEVRGRSDRAGRRLHARAARAPRGERRRGRRRLQEGARPGARRAGALRPRPGRVPDGGLRHRDHRARRDDQRVSAQATARRSSSARR